ncbi:MAG: cellulase [Hyphomicrobiales bacterium]|nr:cellulase [Hyphomicrobiales bacterium]
MKSYAERKRKCLRRASSAFLRALPLCLALPFVVLPAVSQTTQKPPTGARELALNARQLPLGGALKSVELWERYKARFITGQGRVIDSANGLISHSEGQGYGMLLAVAANDRNAFDRIWKWTRANLMVRNDQLIAWRWEPHKRPAVADMNNATDGDILVAWALTEAAELWGELSYRVAARRIAVEVGRKLVLFKKKPGHIVLPALDGFAEEDRSDGPIVNLSYYVYPAFARLPIVVPEYGWSGLSQAGLDFLRVARFGKARLPVEWISAKNGEVKPAAGFPAQFSYNSIRIPLYMAWAGIGDWVHYEPFFQWMTAGKGQLKIVDVNTGKSSAGFQDPGFAAVGDLLKCLLPKGKVPARFATVTSRQHYYPATLHLLAIVAVQMRYPECARR